MSLQAWGKELLWTVAGDAAGWPIRPWRADSALGVPWRAFGSAPKSGPRGTTPGKVARLTSVMVESTPRDALEGG